jgi:hypothetical protein
MFIVGIDVCKVPLADILLARASWWRLVRRCALADRDMFARTQGVKLLRAFK